MLNRIFVLTHNGKMPKDGGKRIGYITTSQILAAKAATKPQTMPEAICYYDLPLCNRWGDCCACVRTDNPSRLEKTDRGLQKVFTCKGCGQKMRD